MNNRYVFIVPPITLLHRLMLQYKKTTTTSHQKFESHQQRGHKVNPRILMFVTKGVTLNPEAYS